MRVACFSTKAYDRDFLGKANEGRHQFVYLDARLTRDTCIAAAGAQAVCAFVNDELDAWVLTQLQRQGILLIVLRCAGFNNVDLEAAKSLGITVARVPDYSPHAVAEHAIALLLCLNRKIHRAYARVREGNFALDGLLGFDLHAKTIGVVGTGKIGQIVVGILAGFGCEILALDPVQSQTCLARGARYVNSEELYACSDAITLHCPLTSATRHLIASKEIARMKDGVLLINTSRGAIVETPSVIRGLKSGKLGGLAIDVYEEEAALFFEDGSNSIIADDIFARLLTFPNVLVTGHQGFFTREALEGIATTTLENIDAFAAGQPLRNRLL